MHQAGQCTSCVQAPTQPAKKTPTPSKPKPTTRKSTPKQSADDALSDSAKKAIDAVTAAAKKLPSTQELLDSGKVTKVPEGGGGGWGGGGGADAEPENHGGKDYPSGHPDAFTKCTFVLSGVLDSMYRQEATDYIKRHGGRVTSAVSGKTTFLLCGAHLPSVACCCFSVHAYGVVNEALVGAFSLAQGRVFMPSCDAGKDTGNSKYTAAQSKNTQLIDEDGLLALVKASAPFVEAATIPAKAPAPTPAPIAASSMYGADDGAGPSTSKPSKASASASARSKAAPSAAPIDPGAVFFAAMHHVHVSLSMPALFLL